MYQNPEKYLSDSTRIITHLLLLKALDKTQPVSLSASIIFLHLQKELNKFKGSHFLHKQMQHQNLELDFLLRWSN